MTDASLRELLSSSGLSAEETARVLRVLEDYLAELERGGRPDPEALLARHPDLADLLKEYLDRLDVLHQAAGQIRVPGSSAAPGPALAASDELGRLGDFQLVREVGRGGMGIVYEAFQLSLERRVALKVLPLAATMDPRQLQRFRNEARAAATLDHPHIVKVYAVGEERAVHFYAMQFIDGQSLADFLRQRLPAESSPGADNATGPYEAGPATTALQKATRNSAPRDKAYFRNVARLGIQAAEALEHAHGLGIVHRDIKPGNLLLDGQGELWVADFGLARTAADSGLTITGDLVGTVRYMSPEQALARHSLVDHRTDIYSLGATLYELLTGQPAVGGEDRQEILLHIANKEPRLPRALDRNIPAELETIVLKALAKEPGERYATARELAEDLTAFLQDRPIKARRPTPGQRAAKWARRHRGVATAAVAGLALAVLILGVSTAVILGMNADLRYQKGITDEALAQRTVALDAERWALYRQRLVNIDRDGLDREFTRARQLLEQCPPELRYWEWRYLNRLCQNDRTPLQGLINSGVSPDGGRLAAAVRTDTDEVFLKVWNTASGKEIFCSNVSRLTGTRTTSVPRIALGPDGRNVAAVLESRKALLRVWEVKTNNVVFNLDTPEVRSICGLAFSPDGKSLAAAGLDQVVKVWDLAAGTEVLTLRAHTARQLSVAFSPDGKSLASAGADGLVNVWWHRASGWETRTLRGHLTVATWVAFSPDGKRLASAGTDKTVRLWDLATGKEVPKMVGHADEVWKVAFSPDGTRVVSTDAKATAIVWDAQTGKEVATLPQAGLSAIGFYRDGDHLVLPLDPVPRVVDVRQSPDVVIVRGDKLFAPSSVAFSPDSRRLAVGSSDRSIRVVDVADGRLHWRELHDPLQSPRQVAFSPDGRRLASGGGTVVRLWDPDRGQEVRKLEGHAGPVFGLAFSPDGKHLASAAGSRGGPRKGGEVKIWEVDTGLEVTSFRDEKAQYFSVAYSPDGTRLAAETDGATRPVKIHLWDLTTGQPPRTLASPLVREGAWGGVAFSRDGRWLVWSPGDGHVRISDAETGQELVKVPGHRAGLSPDGRRLVTAQGAALWVRSAQGEELLALRGHKMPVQDVAVSPDGTRLASAHGLERMVKIWDGTP
jgi:WD40 repeat protein/serine/threonine protein kinase